MAKVPLGCILKVLVAAKAVAGVHDEGLPSMVLLTHIQALIDAKVLYSSIEGGFQVRNKQLWVDVVQEPGKVMTV